MRPEAREEILHERSAQAELERAEYARVEAQARAREADARAREAGAREACFGEPRLALCTAKGRTFLCYPPHGPTLPLRSLGPHSVASCPRSH